MHLEKRFSFMLAAAAVLLAGVASAQVEIPSPAGRPIPGFQWLPMTENRGIGLVYPDAHVDAMIAKGGPRASFFYDLNQYQMGLMSCATFVDDSPESIKQMVGDFCFANEKMRELHKLLMSSTSVDFSSARQIRRALPSDYREDFDAVVKERLVGPALAVIDMTAKLDPSTLFRVESIKNDLQNLKYDSNEGESALIDRALAEIDQRVAAKKKLEQQRIPGL